VIGDENTRVLAQNGIEPNGPMTESILRHANGEQHVLWQFYRVGSLQTDRGTVAQAWYGINGLFSAPLSSVVAMRAPCSEDCDAAREILHSFVQASEFTVFSEAQAQ
jgi:hypothetical protein